jgi:hypothetical protein
MTGQKDAERLKSTGNRPDSPPGKRRLRKIFTGCLSRHQVFLIVEVWRGRSLRDRSQLEVVDQHSVEDGALGMPGTIHARHGGKMASRNGPIP